MAVEFGRPEPAPDPATNLQDNNQKRNKHRPRQGRKGRGKQKGKRGNATRTPKRPNNATRPTHPFAKEMMFPPSNVDHLIRCNMFGHGYVRGSEIEPLVPPEIRDREVYPTWRSLEAHLELAHVFAGYLDNRYRLDHAINNPPPLASKLINLNLQGRPKPPPPPSPTTSLFFSNDSRRFPPLSYCFSEAAKSSTQQPTSSKSSPATTQQALHPPHHRQLHLLAPFSSSLRSSRNFFAWSEQTTGSLQLPAQVASVRKFPSQVPCIRAFRALFDWYDSGSALVYPFAVGLSFRAARFLTAWRERMPANAPSSCSLRAARSLLSWRERCARVSQQISSPHSVWCH